MNREQLISKLQRMQGAKSQKDFAAELGISRAYLCDIYKGRRDPGPAVLEKLGLEKADQYIRTEEKSA